MVFYTLYYNTMETRFQYSWEAFMRRFASQDAKVLEERQWSSTETHQEMVLRIQKEHMVDNIISMLNIIKKRFGEELHDGLAMQLTDFLESDKKPREFTIPYLESMENKVRRYLFLQRKLPVCRIKPIEQGVMSLFALKSETSKSSPKTNQLQDTLAQRDTDRLLSTLHITNGALIIKQKELYCLLEAICHKTHDKTMSFGVPWQRRDPSFAQQYARVLMLPAMEDGLPYSIPVKLISYIREHGIGNVDDQLKCVFRLVDQINQLRGVVSKKSTELLSKEESQGERVSYASDSSSVFTWDLIPIPVNKQAARGIVGMPGYDEMPQDFIA